MSLATAVGGASASVARLLALPFGRRRGAKLLAQMSQQLAPVLTSDTPHGRLRFRCTSSESVRVPARLMAWEPETFAWIDDNVGPEECLWDIGAHVGAFSLYAGLKMTPGKGEVVSFEPSAQTYAVLAENIALSGLGDRVSAYCIAVSDRIGAGHLHMNTSQAGHVGNAFGVPENIFGQFTPAYSQSILGFSVDELVKTVGLRAPDHIKLDVDSIEEQILLGARQTLKTVKSLIIEMEPTRSSTWTDEVRQILAEAGFSEAPTAVASDRNHIFLNARQRATSEPR